MLARADVIEGVAELIPEIQVEATFPDGTTLVAAHQPIACRGPTMSPVPGELLVNEGEHPLNRGRRTLTLVVENIGDRPIQVGSHCHFAETNAALRFDRAAARGIRPNLARGAAMHFEPGQQRTAKRVDHAGVRAVHGFRGQIQGSRRP